MNKVDLRPYRGYQADGERVVSLWNRAMGNQFPLDLRLWRQNQDDDPQFDPGGVFLAESGGNICGLVAARALSVPIAYAPRTPEQGWISAIAVAPDHQRRGLGTRLLEQAHLWLRTRGVRDVHVGGDPGHFFPGVPTSHVAAEAFFEHHRWIPADSPCYDLQLDLRGFTQPPTVERIYVRNPSFRIAPCTAHTTQALMDFLSRTFPGRMLYETQLRLEQERSPQDILLITIGNRVVGFAHTYHNGSQRLGPSIYWRGAMSAPWGGLGPMGISPDVRNTGLGFALLCAAIDRLRTRGVAQMVVDETALLKFYGAAGFKPWKEYRTRTLHL